MRHQYLRSTERSYKVQKGVTCDVVIVESASTSYSHGKAISVSTVSNQPQSGGRVKDAQGAVPKLAPRRTSPVLPSGLLGACMVLPVYTAQPTECYLTSPLNRNHICNASYMVNHKTDVV